MEMDKVLLSLKHRKNRKTIVGVEQVGFKLVSAP
jgi:hypothetical protein